MARTSPTRRGFGTLRKLPSGRYQASYIGPDGARHKAEQTYTHKADGQSWLRDEQLLIERSEWIAPVLRERRHADLVEFGEYATRMIERRQRRSRRPLRDSTAENYRKLLRLAINPTFEGIPVAAITSAKVSKWYDKLPAGTPTQNANAYLLLKSIMNDAVHDKIIATNPCDVQGAGKPKPKHKGQALSPAELAVYGYAVPERYRLLLFLAAWCGLRSGEVRALRRCDFDDDGTRLHVHQTVLRLGDAGEQRSYVYGPPKSDAGERSVAIPPHLQPLVQARLAIWDADPRNTDRTALLVTATDGIHPLHDSVLREAHKKGAEACGHAGMHLHDLRRTGATLAAQAGSTVKEVMRMLGHTQPAVAMIYQVADDERDAERARRMSELALPAAEVIDAEVVG